MATARIGFSSSTKFVGHDTGPHHPERPDRIRAIYLALEKTRLLTGANPFADFDLDFGPMRQFAEPLVELPPSPADTKWLAEVHPAHHNDRIYRACAMGGGILDLGDTHASVESYDTALLAVGAVLACCDAVVAGNVRRAFAAVRPPGHHAEPERAMGFCLFANLAIGARYLQKQHGVGKIAIVDFDVHHGNGTQAVFEEDPSVLFISLHQDPRTCYPGSGYAWEDGKGPGKGCTLNIPMNPGVGDAEYLQAFQTRVLPRVDDFAPEFLMISAGFDAHEDDPLANIEVSEGGFEAMTRLLAAAADRHCGGRIVSALEGGYHLRALGRSVVRHLAGLGAE